ncbi:MAG TPA: homoserine kinase [Anaerolineales bacterium]|jgi:homoserine kinase
MKIHVKVPATTANLGPGFDALGLALDLWNEAEFVATDDRQINLTISGEGEGKLPTDANNSIVEAALQVYDLLKKPCTGLRIHCINRVPLSSGLGSSSAAMLTGLLGANALLGNPFTDEEILKLAIENEGHPDNVSPAMLGGLVASIVFEGRVISLKLPARANRSPMHVTIVLPDFDFPTRQARAILPRQVDRKDAIYNISRAVLVTEALRTGDLDLLGKAMSDALHQPYRLPLIPGAQAAMQAGRHAGAAAVALSGAGPSLIAFSSKQDPAIGLAMQRAFESAGLSARIFELGTSYEGAEVYIV